MYEHVPKKNTVCVSVYLSVPAAKRERTNGEKGMNKSEKEANFEGRFDAWRPCCECNNSSWRQQAKRPRSLKPLPLLSTALCALSFCTHLPLPPFPQKKKKKSLSLSYFLVYTIKRPQNTTIQCKGQSSVKKSVKADFFLKLGKCRSLSLSLSVSLILLFYGGENSVV